MGQFISSLSRLFVTDKPVRILMLGLDNAGKTTILYKLKLGEIVTTIPTIGFNVETVQYRNISFTIWDVGGQQKIRALWKYYYQDTQALIFVVDSSDTERLAEAKEELHAILQDYSMRDVKVLVYANKQDLPGAVLPGDLMQDVGLLKVTSNDWYIQSSNARTSEGLIEGLEWLSKQLA